METRMEDSLLCCLQKLGISTGPLCMRSPPCLASRSLKWRIWLRMSVMEELGMGMYHYPNGKAAVASTSTRHLHCSSHTRDVLLQPYNHTIETCDSSSSFYIRVHDTLLLYLP